MALVATGFLAGFFLATALVPTARVARVGGVKAEAEANRQAKATITAEVFILALVLVLKWLNDVALCLHETHQRTIFLEVDLSPPSGQRLIVALLLSTESCHYHLDVAEE